MQNKGKLVNSDLTQAMKKESAWRNTLKNKKKFIQNIEDQRSAAADNELKQVLYTSDSAKDYEE